MNQPGLTAPSSTSPRQNIPVSFTNLCIFLLFCCAHSCAIQWLRCLPSKGAACHAPPHPAVSCFLPLGDGACGRAGGGGGLRKRKRLSRPNGSCSPEQRSHASDFGARGRHDRWTDRPCWPKQCSWTSSHSPISFLFFLILSQKPRSFKDVHVSLALP